SRGDDFAWGRNGQKETRPRMKVGAVETRRFIPPDVLARFAEEAGFGTGAGTGTVLNQRGHCDEDLSKDTGSGWMCGFMDDGTKLDRMDKEVLDKLWDMTPGSDAPEYRGLSREERAKRMGVTAEGLASLKRVVCNWMKIQKTPMGVIPTLLRSFILP